MRGISSALGAAYLLAGCDAVFLGDPPPAPRPANCGVGAPDEDGDLVADDCDLCPHLANANDFVEVGDDRDGDEVGDRCDPDPDRAASSRLFFGNRDALDWVPNPVWQFDGTAFAVQEEASLLSIRTFGSVTVIADAFFTSDPPGTAISSATVLARAIAQQDRDVPRGYGCRAVEDNDGAGQYLAIERTGFEPLLDVVLARSAPNAFGGITPGAHFILTLRAVGTTLTCTAADEDGRLRSSITATDATYKAGTLGVRATRFGGSFEWVFAIAQ